MKPFDKIKNPITKFAVYFVLSYSFLYAFSFLVDSAAVTLFVKQGNAWFESKINTHFEYNRRVVIKKRENSDTEIHLQMAFQDKRNPNGTIIAKDIYSDLRNEAVMPMIFVLALIIATPLGMRRKLISLAIGFTLILLYIYFKLYVFAYDNYSHPDFTLIELSPLVSGVVYYGNKFLEATGAGTNVIFPVVIWLISSWSDELLNLMNINKYLNKVA